MGSERALWRNVFPVSLTSPAPGPFDAWRTTEVSTPAATGRVRRIPVADRTWQSPLAPSPEAPCPVSDGGTFPPGRSDERSR